jgi:hypothetical protein
MPHFIFVLFLLILFPKKHILILFGLIFFGIMIEVMQDASNYVLEKRIHGDFDPLDVKYNLKGIFLVFVPFYGLKILGKIFK